MPKRILVVEDDPAALRLASYSLEAVGYEVLTAVNGLEGLLLARREQPAVVVLDVMLPGIDGFEVCHRLRSDPDANVAQLPVLMVTAKSQQADRDAGERVGATAYLTKPATPGEIAESVANLLSEHERLSA